MLPKTYLSFFVLCAIFFVVGLSTTTAQSTKAIPKKGEGVYSFLKRHNRSPKKSKAKFYKLNKGKFSKSHNLLGGVSYLLPDELTVFHYPIFGKKEAKFKQISNKLSGAVFYLVSGHGGPDCGAIGIYNNTKLYEDEYAYDITLRLAKRLIENGAKVYCIIQDAKDGIREDAVLKNSKQETCMGAKIPLSQLARLKQRTQTVNWLYHQKDKHSKYKRCLVIHVDSRSKRKRLDVFFYHYPGSKKGKRLAYNLSNTIEEKYGDHQPNRSFSGTVSSRELYVVRNIAPALVFAELGNIQNPKDQKRFIMPNNRQALANWLYEGFELDFQKNK